MDGTPIALFELHPLCRFARNRIAQQRARVRLPGRYCEFNRHSHFLEIRRFRITRIGRKGFENMFADQVLRIAPGGTQIGRVGTDDDEAGINQ
jgi:hypothetical protein